MIVLTPASGQLPITYSEKIDYECINMLNATFNKISLLPQFQ